MPDYKEFLKGGWHPEKEGTTLKSQVKGVFNRNKSPPRREPSKPLSALRDPSTFAPPPKRVGSAGAVPPSSGTAPPPYHAPEREAEADEQPPPAPQPYRVNTTGLSTSHLPPPPVRGTTHPPPSPPPGGSVAGRAPPPALPPRLPPRNSASPAAASSPVAAPPTGLLSRGGSSQISELQSRFSKLSPSLGSTNVTSSSTSSPPPAEGTTWAQKQAALRTVSQFQKDPSSISVSDARSAASTANNFRQRHGEEVASGMRTAGRLDEKYGITGKVGQYAGTASQGTKPGGSPASSSGGLVSAGNLSAAAGMLGKKKPPPPPPPKRRDLSVPSSSADETPPPVPMSTRPGF